MLEIDGSYGEGGGQILRTALSLSCLTGWAFSIVNIRRQRRKPGLMPQHLAAVRAAQAVAGATVEGASPGSVALAFRPGVVQGGTFSFDIGTAGSVGLVLQTLIPPLLNARQPSRVTLTGGTHVPASPSITYLINVFAPMLRQLNVRLHLTVDACGFYPRGGGKVLAEIVPGDGPIAFNPGIPSGPVRINGLSAVCHLPLSIAERQRDAALQVLGQEKDLPQVEIVVSEVSGPGLGTFLFLAMERHGCLAGCTALGARGKPAETVGREAATEMVRHLATRAALDPHLADQVIPYLALSRGESTFTTSCITPHLLTNLWVVGLFLSIRYRISGEEGEPGLVRIAPADKPGRPLGTVGFCGAT